jgi:hypothetical protein
MISFSKDSFHTSNYTLGIWSLKTTNKLVVQQQIKLLKTAIKLDINPFNRISVQKITAGQEELFNLYL